MYCSTLSSLPPNHAEITSLVLNKASGKGTERGGSANGMVERFFFLLAQGAVGALSEFPEFKRANCDSNQTQHLHAKRIEHAPNLAVLAFVEHDFNPRVSLAGTDEARPPGLEPLAIRHFHAPHK